MIKVNDKMLEKFYNIMDDYNEFIFGDDEEIRRQLETCLNTQGYWSGCTINIWYDEYTKEFYAYSRY